MEIVVILPKGQQRHDCIVSRGVLIRVGLNTHDMRQGIDTECRLNSDKGTKTLTEISLVLVRRNETSRVCVVLIRLALRTLRVQAHQC